MTTVVFLACVLVSGLEWFAVARIGRLKAQNAELLRRLEFNEKEIESVAATRLAAERFDEEKKTTDLWREEVESSLGALRIEVDKVPPRLGRLEGHRADVDDRIAGLAADTRAGDARLEAARRAWEARLGQVRSEIPAPSDMSAITDLKTALAALDRRVEGLDVPELRRGTEFLKRRLDTAATRLDLVEASVHDHPDLARTLDSIDETVNAVFTYVLKELDDRVTMALKSEPAGAATVRGALLIDSDALRPALSHLFEDYAQRKGGHDSAQVGRHSADALLPGIHGPAPIRTDLRRGSRVGVSAGIAVHRRR